MKQCLDRNFIIMGFSNFGNQMKTFVRIYEAY